MNIYYTIDERYLKAIEKLNYGNIPKAKLLLEEILEEEPGYGKAHFHLGCIYYEYLVEYPLAVKHMELALQFEPEFPDVYHRYLWMLNELGCHEKLVSLAQKALHVRGICKACVYLELGNSHEKNRNWALALESYQEAYLQALSEYDLNRSKNGAERVTEKRRALQKWNYVVS
jgi:tetratricopeptide (TPR) repeat protein